jgi:hypothetical protein
MADRAELELSHFYLSGRCSEVTGLEPNQRSVLAGLSSNEMTHDDGVKVGALMILGSRCF